MKLPIPIYKVHQSVSLSRCAPDCLLTHTAHTRCSQQLICAVDPKFLIESKKAMNGA